MANLNPGWLYKKLDEDGNPIGALIREEVLIALGITDMNPEALAEKGYAHYDDQPYQDSDPSNPRQLHPLREMIVSGYQKRGDLTKPWDGWYENTYEEADKTVAVGGGKLDANGKPERRAMTQDEKDWKMKTLKSEQQTNIRRERDRLLAATDWQAISDTPDMRTPMKDFRQALRDITKQAGYDSEQPELNMEWPTVDTIEAKKQYLLRNFEEGRSLSKEDPYK